MLNVPGVRQAWAAGLTGSDAEPLAAGFRQQQRLDVHAGDVAHIAQDARRRDRVLRGLLAREVRVPVCDGCG